jgi:hypothetical protein
MFRPEILKCHGIDWSLLKPADAIKLADEFVKKNREVHPWIEEKHPDKISTIAGGIGSLFYYIHQDGITDDASVNLSQEMSMEGNVGKGKPGFNLELCPAAILGLPENSGKLALEGGGEPQIAEQK